ncbi:MAG: hypothetical protein ACTSUI_00075 [Promethearchaeota archaeon]
MSPELRTCSFPIMHVWVVTLRHLESMYDFVWLLLSNHLVMNVYHLVFNSIASCRTFFQHPLPPVPSLSLFLLIGSQDWLIIFEF